MEILGIEFKDNEKIENVLNELKRRGINPDNKVIPILYKKERTRINLIKNYEGISAQEILNEVNLWQN